MGDIGSWLPGTVSAAVSVAAAITSTAMWFRARDERREAGRQAKLATDAAVESAGHLGSIADVHVEQQKATAALTTAKERDPWQPQFGHNQVSFHNDSQTSKYNVEVKIAVDGQPWAEKAFPYVGPQRPMVVDYDAILGEMSATITWYLDEAFDRPPEIQVVEW
jgi:hypothetical protein